MKRKRNVFSAVGNFITGKGFYLVVLLCVAAIALSGYYLIRSVGGDLPTGEDAPVAGTAEVFSSPEPLPLQTATELEPDTPVTQAPAPSPQPSPEPEPEPESSPQPSPQPPSEPVVVPLVFTWPVKGTVLTDHSVEALAYDVTMGDWRTHEGLDIAAAVGTRVLATAAGTVTAVYQDELMGTTVVIDHGDGLVSLYSNLAAAPTVKVGDEVSTGTIIGTVGSTAAAESELAPHLHFAMLQDGKAVDPTDRLPEK